MFFDLEQLGHRESYRLLVNAVVPRPIALVTTVDLHGHVNAAPFSFFNVMGHDPPILVLGVEHKRGGGLKDTPNNIRSTREFVVNLVSENIAERMNICAVDFDHGVDELNTAGLTATASSKVAPPCILESPVSLECREMMSIGIGEGRTLVVGNIVAMHLKDECWDRDAKHVRAAELGLIGRMHGDGWYVRTTDLFQIRKLALTDIEGLDT